MPLGRMLKIVFPILYNEKSNPCYMLYLVNCCLLSRFTDILAAKIISIFIRKIYYRLNASTYSIWSH